MIILASLTPIQHVIYEEGSHPSSWTNEWLEHGQGYYNDDGPATTYEDVLNVLPGIDYSVKVEVLRNDLGAEHEKVSRIALNGHTIGDCNPDGSDYDCTFFDCSETLSSNYISSTNGSIVASLTYEGHSWDCDCDKATWECVRENTKIGFTKMLAVARITLTPLNGN